MKKIIKILFVLSFLALLSTGYLAAENYVSLNGEFYITYPDDWYQVDYNTVDYFLSSVQANQESFQYEAVFAERKAVPFYNGNYLILTIDLIGELNNRQIDSVLTDLDSIFGEGEKYFPAGNLLSDLKTNSPYYDRTGKTITILNEISGDDQVLKKNIWVLKFYDKGIANFYFYAPDSVFESSKIVFNNMVTSFSTEDIAKAMPKEELKLADVDREGKDVGLVQIIILAGIVVVIILVVVIYIRKKKH